MVPLTIGTLAWHSVLLEFSKNIPDLETFLKVVVLVGIDKLEVLSTVEDDDMVLIVGLSVSKNGVPGNSMRNLGRRRPVSGTNSL